LKVQYGTEGLKTKLMAIALFVVMFLSLASAVELGGQAGKDALADLGNTSGLWGWGSAPAGKITENGSLIAGFWILPADRSSMEMPLSQHRILEIAR
jgi:hypothetical protein